MKTGKIGKAFVVSLTGLSFWGAQAYADDNAVEIIRQSLLGAGVGAISAEVSGGKAGKGALIGAGTQVIGTALIGILTGPSSSSRSNQAAPVYAQQPVYSQPSYAQTYVQPTQTVYVQPQPQPQIIVQQIPAQPVYTTYRYEPTYIPQPAPPRRHRTPRYDRGWSQDESNRNILRQGLLGAGVGAISAEVSGGKAGTGALVGAGSNVIGGALIQLLSA